MKANTWARLDSNQQPTPYEGAALPLSYRPAHTRDNHTIAHDASLTFIVC